MIMALLSGMTVAACAWTAMWARPGPRRAQIRCLAGDGEQQAAQQAVAWYDEVAVPRQQLQPEPCTATPLTSQDTTPTRAFHCHTPDKPGFESLVEIVSRRRVPR